MGQFQKKFGGLLIFIPSCNFSLYNSLKAKITFIAALQANDIISVGFNNDHYMMIIGNSLLRSFCNGLGKISKLMST